MVCTRRPGERGSGGYSTRILTRLVKLWTGSVGREGRQHNFALFHRILRSQSSSRPGRPSRPSEAGIGGESSNIDINQPTFVVHREGIPSDYCIWKRCGIWSLRSYQHPVGSKAGSGQVYPRRNQVMTIPTRRGNLASFRIRWINWRRADSGGLARNSRIRYGIVADAPPD